MKKDIDTATLLLLSNAAGHDPLEDCLRENIRTTIEAVFEEELEAFLGRCRYDRGPADLPFRQPGGKRPRRPADTLPAERACCDR